MGLSLLKSVGLISGKNLKCFISFLEVLKSESLVTNFRFRKCVITLPDDISIKTTAKLLAAVFIVNQKYLFSFQNKPKPNAGAWHKKPEAMREPEQCGATGAWLLNPAHSFFLCVLTPPVIMEITRVHRTRLLFTASNVHLL